MSDLSIEVPLQSVFEEMTPHYEEKELAYLAGFFDGEGNIDILHQKKSIVHPYEQYRLRVSVTQKHPEILYEYKSMFDGKVYLLKSGGYQWYAYGLKASNFLRFMGPYLRIKRKECVKAIEFQQKVRNHGGKMNPTPLSLLAKQSKLHQEFRHINVKRNKA